MAGASRDRPVPPAIEPRHGDLKQPAQEAHRIEPLVRPHESECRFELGAVSWAVGTIGQVTLSMGVAMAREAESLEQLLEHADAALYTAKRLGRNRVEVAPTDPPIVMPS
jgi:GGDEF domain-containing protein